ncbi:hypothetical protein EK21DRAFT_75787 [Setomelanomma holmii]|uniref:PNPLA domain-containing protein n=1 Tax=Setomelanomma holmii TaxID=210430 RepID=A0A9P4LHZ1_9PLEO|nr:hypothetical protein EK21DRAFT_75787 [Setomelanomma holmii]
MPGNDLRLLALDGGGVRGLSALMILEQLMEAVNPDAPPKPCDYFDMIGGTSTGGLIAVMLGRLQMSVVDCIAAYLSLSKRVFCKSRHRVTIKGKVQGRFDSEELARAVREVMSAQGLAEDALLKDSPDAPCKVFVCATSKQTCETVCLTSYRTPRGNSDLLNSARIWEACRATSAATSFFDPIAVGRFGEEFVDGAAGANNPVREMWDQAQLVWGPEPLEGRVKCLVSIGTGVPSLKPFKDDVLHIGQTLVAIATETEQTTERFRRERALLNSTGRYYRFNVVRGLEDIGLEEAAKVKEMAAATRRYISSHEVHTQMQACAGIVAGREYFGEYRVAFSLEGVPTVRTFVDRPAAMAEMERVLLPGRQQSGRQKRYVVRGLGGIGKTQLAVEFARRHHRQFGAIFWLDGRSEDILKQSIASCASRIPQGQIAETSRAYAAGGSVDLKAVVGDVLSWLARPDNTAWLLIFDNVDREYSRSSGDAEAYDVKRYFSGADHGSVLITTRLARLEQLGESQQLGKVSKEQGRAIFENWYKREHDGTGGERLLALLDGLPLAIAQAGAYLEESGVGLTKYLEFYEQQWSELMGSDLVDAPLHDYPDRSVWTTWVISYKAIRKVHETTANLLLLWSFLDNKDLWYGMFAATCEASPVASEQLKDWIGDIAINEREFGKSMQLLRNYSMIEEIETAASYATHPVVHRWTHCYEGQRFAPELGKLAIVAVGCAVPDDSEENCWAMQRRLMPHAQVCSKWLGESQRRWVLGSGGRAEAELNPNEKDIHTSTLDTVNNLGLLYADQGKLAEAEQMYVRALRGKEAALGHEHTSTLSTVNNLATLYYNQGKLAEAEQMFLRALRGYKAALGPEHTSTLHTVNNLGILYKNQGKPTEAEQMYLRALRGYKAALGPGHMSTLNTVNNLGALYYNQGKLAEAEQMYERALRGKEAALGPEHTSTLDTVNNLGLLYADQGKLAEAEQMYVRALRGKEAALGPEHMSTIGTVYNLGLLHHNQGKLGEAEQIYLRALRGYEKALGNGPAQQYLPALNAFENLGNLYRQQGKPEEARAMHSSALAGLQHVLGPSSSRCVQLASRIHALSASQARTESHQQLAKHQESSCSGQRSSKQQKTTVWQRIRSVF